MIFKISSEKIEEFIEKQYSIDGMVFIHDFELWLEEQPRVGEWIPCSEGLPEEEGMYLITAKVYDKKEVQYAFYQKSIEMFICNGTAIAWQPLPPAFEGE